jgi:glutamate racemase
VSSEECESQCVTVGVIDAGLGGLTVVGNMVHRYPKLTIRYFGDCANMPFSIRGNEWIVNRSQEIINRIEGRCREVVIACNTISTAVGKLTSRRHLYDIIHPTYDALNEIGYADKLLIVGTPTTVTSSGYENALRAGEKIHVPCPMLATTIERYGAQSVEVKKCIDAEITNALPARDGGLVVIVLACTHYPPVRWLIEREVYRRMRPGALRTVDPGQCLTDALEFSQQGSGGRVEIVINGKRNEGIERALNEFISFAKITVDAILFEEFG